MTLEATTGVTDPRNLLPNISDISGPISHDERIQRILEVLGSKLGPEPYGSSAYETASPIGENYRLALVDLMLSLPHPTMGHALFRTSANLDQISRHAATHKALETMYRGPVPESNPEMFLWARLFIENIHNSMAVRNRLRIVEAEFGSFMERRLANEHQDTEVLSIASGSSRAIMEVLSVLNGRGHDRIKLRMVDLNREALQDGQKLVTELGINHAVEFVRAHCLSFKRYLQDGYNPDFVEIVGLLDYLLEEKQIINLLAEVRDHLSEGGVVLYSNIAPNDEEKFTHQIVRWREMIYRPANALVEFAQQAGFSDHTIRVITEPLGIYNIVSARR